MDILPLGHSYWSSVYGTSIFLAIHTLVLGAESWVFVPSHDPTPCIYLGVLPVGDPCISVTHVACGHYCHYRHQKSQNIHELIDACSAGGVPS
jgi:hypothetical protein